MAWAGLQTDVPRVDSHGCARRILDPMHPTKLPRLSKALAALGRRLVVGVKEIAA